MQITKKITIRVGIPITGLTLHIFVPVLSHDLDFQVVFLMFNDLRKEVFVHFVDYGGIVDHQCIDFLSIKYYM